jgi:hypothetical protein
MERAFLLRCEGELEMVTVNIVFREPPPDQPEEIRAEYHTVPRVGERLFFPHIKHCLRQVVDKVGYVNVPDGSFVYLLVSPDPDQTDDELWSDAIQ